MTDSINDSVEHGKVEKIRWTREEIETFNRMAAEGCTLVQIAEAMPNRSEIALLSRSRKFGTRVSQRKPFVRRRDREQAEAQSAA